ncbi:MAG: protein phosphatase 2C domain-containing protein [Oscillospiraceae bacterium]
MIKIFAITDIGNHREINQDGYYVNGISSSGELWEEDVTEIYGDNALIAVADGVGGTEDGVFAVECCIDYFQENPFKTDFKLIGYVNDVNNWIKKKSLEMNIDTGTTIAGLLVKNGEKIVFNVGDSEVFAVNSNGLEKLSVDDNTAELFKDAKILSDGVIAVKSPLTQCLGKSEVLENIHKKTVYNEKFLICTDGLTDMLSAESIFQILNSGNSIEENGRNLVAEAKKNGGFDNITLILISEEE